MHLERNSCLFSTHSYPDKNAVWFSLAEYLEDLLLSFLPFLMEPQGTKTGRQARLCEPSLIPIPHSHLAFLGGSRVLFPLSECSLFLFYPSVPHPSVYLCLSLLLSLSTKGQYKSVESEADIVAALMELADQRKR